MTSGDEHATMFIGLAGVEASVCFRGLKISLQECQHLRAGAIVDLGLPLSKLIFRLEVTGATRVWTGHLVGHGAHVGLALRELAFSDVPDEAPAEGLPPGLEGAGT